MRLSTLPFFGHPMNGFAGRLAYVRWLRAMGQPTPETDRALAERAGVTEAWLRKWQRSVTAPSDYPRMKGLATALDVALGWLIEQEGPPPEPEAWTLWQRRIVTGATEAPTTQPAKRRA